MFDFYNLISLKSPKQTSKDVFSVFSLPWYSRFEEIKRAFNRKVISSAGDSWFLAQETM